MHNFCNFSIILIMERFSSTTKSICYLIFSAFCFALMAALVKLAGNIYFVQKAFFRNAVAFVIAFFLLLKERRQKGPQAVQIPKGCLKWLILRATAGTVAIFGNFYAIEHLVLSDAAILNKMSPFFAIIFSFFIMKEKIKPVPLIAITVAFIGSMLVVKPSFNFVKFLPSLAGFLGGIGAGFAYSCVRKLGSLKCNRNIIVFFFSGYSMLFSIPYLITSFNPMTFYQTLLLLCGGLCSALGQFAITAAYYYAPAREISIYDYTQLIFSTIFGIIFFGQFADIYSVVGYTIIVSMAILNFVWNKKNYEKQQKSNLIEKS